MGGYLKSIYEARPTSKDIPNAIGDSLCWTFSDTPSKEHDTCLQSQPGTPARGDFHIVHDCVDQLKPPGKPETSSQVNDPLSFQPSRLTCRQNLEPTFTRIIIDERGALASGLLLLDMAMHMAHSAIILAMRM